ncbi:MAG: hypothetical protein R3D43_00465 [Tepidamorphaceae bacterium]
MRRAGLNVEQLSVPGTPAEAADQIEDFGTLIGQGLRGKAEARKLRDAFSQPVGEGTGRPIALYLQRRGVVTGRGTMMDALMRAAGLENAVETQGFTGSALNALRPSTRTCSSSTGMDFAPMEMRRIRAQRSWRTRLSSPGFLPNGA